MTEASQYESAFENDVGLDADGKKFFSSNDNWLKLQKGQTLRAALLYYHPVDMTAVKALMAKAREEKRKPTPEEIQECAKKALEARAASFSPAKTIDQLTPAEKLDRTLAQFKKMLVHYQDGLGYALSKLGKCPPEEEAVWKKLPEPKFQFSTVLLVYPCDNNGVLDAEQLKAGARRILPWRFNQQTFEEIWNLNEGLQGNGLTIANQDLKIECKESKQKYPVVKVSFLGKAIWQQSEKFANVVLNEAMPLYPKLVPFREMTTTELRQKLGLGGGAASAVADVTGEDFTGLLDNV
jgi:hypothetical protein